MKKCPKCELDNLDHLAFCVECGTDLSAAKQDIELDTGSFSPPRAGRLKVWKSLFYHIQRNLGSLNACGINASMSNNASWTSSHHRSEKAKGFLRTFFSELREVLTELLPALRERGVGWETVTLHVGLDTFRPVSAERVEDHQIHSEWAGLSARAARHINDVTLAGGRIVAVGTTSVRTLEWGGTGAQGIDPYDSQACPWQRVAAFEGMVDLFIRPGYRFRAVDVLVTNFHLPRSSLLMLVSAFAAQAHPADYDAGRRMLLDAYAVAKSEGYRFFSFGDAMLLIG